MKANAKTSSLMLLAVVLIAVVANGCASGTGAITPIAPLKEGVKLSGFADIVVEVKSGENVPMTANDRERILNLIVTKIKKEDPTRFKEINSSNPRPSTLHASINVTQYEKGSAFARFMLAGLGQIQINADVLLKDREQQEPLAKYEVKKTFAWGGVYGAATTIEDVEEGFANAVVAILLGKEEK